MKNYKENYRIAFIGVNRLKRLIDSCNKQTVKDTFHLKKAKKNQKKKITTTTQTTKTSQETNLEIIEDLFLVCIFPSSFVRQVSMVLAKKNVLILNNIKWLFQVAVMQILM